ncbi:MAG: phosphoglycerate dehydrogenase [Nitrococcus mobilis]|nr:phosphoglycerate dehydrogenase [Nitrococcus mobilis]
MYKILTLNNISVKGLERLPRDRYEISSETQNPDAVLLRSASMHGMEIPGTLKAVGRAGAGVNNIPVAQMSERGIAVFNAPGANANAVKELVVAAMFLAARDICQAWEFARHLTGSDREINDLTEAGKKRFVGFELPGRTLGVIGLGAVGVLVANTARAMGMKVIGYDPQITVRSAWRLASDVQPVYSVDELMAEADMITFHVPENDATRGLVNAKRLGLMREGVVLLNFARSGIVDEAAVVEALNVGKVHAYICDFPTNALKDHPRCITLPHIGASTHEAQDNCAVMVADEVREYLEAGNVRNSVNLPEIVLPRTGQGDRLTVVNANVPNMLGQISTAVAEASLNIEDMYNKAKGNLAYTVADVEGKITTEVVERIRATEGVLAVRVIE